MTNPYFAYSLKQEFNQKTSPTAASPPEPIKTKKSRACDACSIRKTKCDNERPCRQCVNNNLECSELRQRKKPGPRSIRRKTINSINTLRNNSESPENVLLQIDFKNLSLPGLSLVISEIGQHSPEWFASCVPYTTPSMASEIQGLLPQLMEDPVINPSQSLRLYSKRYAILTLLLTLLTISKTPENCERIDVLLGAVQRHVSSMSQVCTDFVFFEKQMDDPEVHYYLLFADLHMFSYMWLRSPQSSHAFVRLKSATSHYSVLSSGRSFPARLDEISCVLFFWERHAALFNVDASYRRSGFGIFSGETPKCFTSTSSNYLNTYYEMLMVFDSEGVFKHGVPDLFTYDAGYSLGLTENELQQTSTKLQSTIQNSQHIKKAADMAICQLLALGMRFKILVMSALTPASLYKEVLSIMESYNLVFTGTYDHSIQPSFIKHSWATQLTELLEYFLLITSEMELDSLAMDSLIQFTKYLNFYLEKDAEVCVKRPLVSNWLQKLFSSEQ